MLECTWHVFVAIDLSNHMLRCRGSRMSYQEAPMAQSAFSIIPRIQLSKPRPTFVQTVDVPPARLDDAGTTHDLPDESGDDCFGITDADSRIKNESEGRRNVGGRNDSSVPEGEVVVRTASSSSDSIGEAIPKTDAQGTIAAAMSPRMKRSPIIEVLEGNDHSHDASAAFRQKLPSDVSCVTCRKHLARYTCPKCEAPYCSVRCYRLHDGSAANKLHCSSNTQQNDDGAHFSVGDIGGGLCTESFYKDRVLNEYKLLGDAEDGKRIRDILSRMHGDIADALDRLEQKQDTLSRMLTENGSNQESEVIKNMRSHVANNMRASVETYSSLQFLENKPSNEDAEQISDEDLAELAAYVLQMEDDGDGKHYQNKFKDQREGEIDLDSIPPHLLHAFECALASATFASESSFTFSEKDEKKLADIWNPFLGNDLKSVDQICNTETMTGAIKKKNTVNVVNRSSKGISQCIPENATKSPINSPNRVRTKWTPWWVPDGKELGQISVLSPTLDERIVSLPPLFKLQPNHSSTNRNLSLAFNILEVLYATSFAIRSAATNLGQDNISSSCTPKIDENDIHRAVLLLSQSMVLSNDVRYQSVSEVLASCTERQMEIQKTSPISKSKIMNSPKCGDNQGRKTHAGNSSEVCISWEMLAADVAILSNNRRYTLRMLFEALDICKIGIEYARQQLKKMKSIRNINDSTYTRREAEILKGDYEENKRQYKLAYKKVEYFLSWSAQMWMVEMSRQISDEVRAFVNDWKLPDVQVEESALERLVRDIHTNENCRLMSAPGILDIGFGDGKGHSSDMNGQMISVSSVKKKPLS